MFKKIFLLFIIAISFTSVNADMYFPENNMRFGKHIENDYSTIPFLVIGLIVILGIVAFIRKKQSKNGK